MAYAVQVRKYFKTSRNIFRKLENKYDSEIYIYLYKPRHPLLHQIIVYLPTEYFVNNQKLQKHT